MPSSIPKLTSRQVFRDLANRLESSYGCLDAMNVLMKFADAEDCELLRYGPQFIALMEIARITVRHIAGICLLALCYDESQVPYKSAYFKLLVWIKRRRDAFPVYMNDRISDLLATMEHTMVLRTRGIDPRVQLGIPELIIIKEKKPAASTIPSKAVCSRISNDSPTL